MKKISIILFLLPLPGSLFAQTPQATKAMDVSSAWNNHDPFKTDVFIENLGQFDAWAETPMTIKYAVNNSDQVFFTQQGLTFKLPEAEKISEEEREERERDPAKKPALKVYYVNMQWEGCNPNAVLETRDQTEGYYTFSDKGYENVKAKGFRKLTYVNLYNGIDVEYIIPEKGGIKYSIIVHPGADVSKVKMEYTGNVNGIEKNTDGNIFIKTPIGKITDHAPQSFYQNRKNIGSSFKINGNTVSFHLEEEDHGQTVIIDPWTTSPANLTTDKAAFDVDVDGAGNVYVAGGTDPFKLSKYTSAGGYLWTYTRPPWGGGYSKFCVIPNGTSFIGSGYGWGTNPTLIVKVDAAGALVKTSNPIPGSDEIWKMLYNRCTGQLLAFGGGVYTGFNNMMQITDLNLSGSTSKNINGGSTASGCCNDVGDAVMDFNGDIYSLITTSNGNANADNNRIVKNTLAGNYVPPCAFKVNTGYNFNESTNPGVPGFTSPNQGSVTINALKLNSNYVYSYDGKTLKAWNKTSGAMLGSVVVNAAYADGFNRTHEGIEADECDNVYVGGNNAVHVYSFNGSSFSTLPSITTDITSEVYSLHLDKLTNSLYVSGKGFLTSAPAAICNLSPITLVTSGNGCAGNASVSASGGSAPYTYLWSNGATTSSISGLTPGTYTVTVLDASCSPVSQTDSAKVNLSMSLTTTTTPASCGSSNGTATITSTAGASPYTYLWSPSGGTSSAATGLTAGNYFASVTDANGCTGTATVTVSSVGTPSVSLASQTNIPCNGGNVGAASVTVSSGIAPYTYAWTPSGGASSAATGLGVGNYTATVTDVNGCSGTTTVNITATGTPSVSIAGQTNILCKGNNTGFAAVAASGANAPYTYAWFPSGETTSAVSGLAAANYTATVTDASGCSVTQTISITEPGALTGSVSLTASCGGSNGTAVISMSGGTSPYTYNWSPTGGTNAMASGLSTGNYSITITDANGCTFVQTTTVIPGGMPNIVLASQTNILCNGTNTGQAAVTANGATAPYTYAWFPSGGISSAATGLMAGNYTATVTDAGGCTATQTVAISEPPAITFTITATPDLCGNNNGTASVSSSGGAVPHSYNWSTGETDAIASGLGMGNYTATITDGNGCTKTGTVTVTSAGSAIADAGPDIIVSSGITATLTATGGGNYSWSTGETTASIMVSPAITTTYTVTVTDASGCTAMDEVTVFLEADCNNGHGGAEFFLPNAFSPNGDGENDQLCLQGWTNCIQEFGINIYDRWGERIFKSNDKMFCWNGTYKDAQENAAVYVYYLNAVLVTGERIKREGNISLIR